MRFLAHHNCFRVIVYMFLLVGELVTLNGTALMPASVYVSDLSFGSVVNLSQDPADSQSPLLATAGTNVYAAWLNNTGGNPDIVFKASNNDATSFRPFVNLSNTPNGYSSNPEIAAVGSNVYVVWEENVSSSNQDVFFRGSSDGGNTWTPSLSSPAANLSHDSRSCYPGLGCVPQVAASGSNVYVTWQNEVSGSCGQGCTPVDVFFVVSTNNGGSFTTTPVNLSNDKVSSEPAIAAAGSNVYAVWEGYNGGKNDLFFRASTDGGSSWNPMLSNPAINLSNNLAVGAGANSQQIVAISNNVYVAWTNSTSTDQTVFRASLNKGANFGNTLHLSTAGSIDHRMAVSGSYVHVVWEDHTVPGVSRVSYSVSNNNGGVFTAPVPLSSSTGFALNPEIASTGSNVYLGWQDSTVGTSDVLFKSSSDNGTSYGSEFNLSGSPSGFSISPAVVAGDNAYVAWQDDYLGNVNLGNDDILFRAGSTVTTIHDVAVSNIVASRDFAYNGVSSNPVNITVTVANLGSASESFTVTAKAGANVIGTQTATVAAAGTLNVVFNWHAELLARGQYQLTAQASQVTGETNTGNNDFTDGLFTVRLKGDASNDCTVNIVDLATVGANFGRSIGQAGFNTAADMNYDQTVNIIDLSTVGSVFGQTC